MLIARFAVVVGIVLTPPLWCRKEQEQRLPIAAVDYFFCLEKQRLRSVWRRGRREAQRHHDIPLSAVRCARALDLRRSCSQRQKKSVIDLVSVFGYVRPLTVAPTCSWLTGILQRGN